MSVLPLKYNKSEIPVPLKRAEQRNTFLGLKIADIWNYNKNYSLSIKKEEKIKNEIKGSPLPSNIKDLYLSMFGKSYTEQCEISNKIFELEKKDPNLQIITHQRCTLETLILNNSNQNLIDAYNIINDLLPEEDLLKTFNIDNKNIKDYTIDIYAIDYDTDESLKIKLKDVMLESYNSDKIFEINFEEETIKIGTLDKDDKWIDEQYMKEYSFKAFKNLDISDIIKNYESEIKDLINVSKEEER